jgi:hypothetical protein
MSNRDQSIRPEAGNGSIPMSDLTRENERLRLELAASHQELHDVRQTLQKVAPECLVTEAEMREIIDHPVPLREALSDLERLLGATHAHPYRHSEFVILN